MPQSPEIHELSDQVIARAYDPGSYQRGINYAREGRATLLSSQPGSIKGIVRGSGQQTYITEIWWTRSTHGAVSIDDDRCSCPLGGACKHAVALLVTARRAATPDEPPDWRTALAKIAEDGGASTSGGVPLALEVAMDAATTSRHGHHQPASVTLRPLRQGKAGKWIKSGASWRELASPYQYSSQNISAEHLSVIKSIAASVDHDRYYSDGPTLLLSRFTSDIWFHLTRAVEVGITLVDTDHLPGAASVSSEVARVHVDLTADDFGAVTLTTRLTCDGEVLALDTDRGGLIGQPPHGLFIEQHGVIRLIPLADPLHPDLARLLTAPPLNVPSDDVDELIDGYEPILARYATVGSSDGSVEITHTQFECLTLTVERTSIDSASLHWGVRYRRGERVTSHPLLGVQGLGSGRDRTAERAAVDMLELPTHLLASLVGPSGGPHALTVTGPTTITLLSEVVPWLRDKGQVAVEVTGDLPALREAVEDPLVSLAVSDASSDRRDGTDWFDLAVEVTVDGEPVEFARLFAALTLEEELLVLPSGTWMRLDQPELTKLRALIDEARGLADHDGSAEVRVNRFQASWWEELTGLGVVAHQSSRWADSVARMQGLTEPKPVTPPKDLAASLRPYQQQGFDWLAFLHENKLGGILADDMGLGKTVQALALCLHVHAQNPDARFLVVAPTSVVDNWRHEAATFAPTINVQTIHATASRRHESLEVTIGAATIVITSYALFRIEFDEYQMIDWELLLLDEAQFVKNHQGKTYQCVRRLNAAVKIAITGTPMENSLMDLWSLLSIVAPGLYPDPKRFSEVYRKPIEGGDAPELLATLRHRIAPLMRRRTKDAVLTDLPPKIEQTVDVELNARHSRIYQTQLQRQRQKVLGLVGDVQKNRFEILKSLTVLRQLSLDPGLIDPTHDNVGSAKLDRLVSDLTQVVAEGHRALVFSQFTRYLARVRTRLDEAGITYAYLDGRTRKRDAAISAFTDGDVPVFVISLKAGGVGLNLTEADYCFILDPWWNPAVETQAVDRTHRIGQRRTVMVYRYVSTGTIEEKVMDLKARKAALFASVMDAEGALSGALTANDIRGLLDLSA